jgi:hypothetical protein
MDFEQVLASLQAQFAGQMVLYATDLAKILGRSEKAVAHLLARNHLPFQVKKVGKVRCVDIFQVAKWLSTDASLANEIADPETASGGPKRHRTSSQRTRTGQNQAAAQCAGMGTQTPKAVPTPDDAFGPFAKIILERRKADALRLQGFALGLGETDSLVFMLEVLDAFVLGSTLVQSTYVVTLCNMSPKMPGLWATTSKRYFDDERAATEFAHSRLTNLQEGMLTTGTQIKIEINDEIVFWCAHSKKSGIVVINNTVELALPENLG